MFTLASRSSTNDTIERLERGRRNRGTEFSLAVMRKDRVLQAKEKLFRKPSILAAASRTMSRPMSTWPINVPSLVYFASTG